MNQRPSLTLTETERLLGVVRDLRSEGAGIIYVTHRLMEVKEIADRGRSPSRMGQMQEASPAKKLTMTNGQTYGGTQFGNILSASQCRETSELLSGSKSEDRSLPLSSRSSIDVGRGEILGLAGLVGAGRSEAAQAIFGVDPAVELKLKLGGQTLEIKDPQDAIKHGIYLIPEDRRQRGPDNYISIRETSRYPRLIVMPQEGLIAFDREKVEATVVCRKFNVKASSIRE